MPTIAATPLVGWHGGERRCEIRQSRSAFRSFPHLAAAYWKDGSCAGALGHVTWVEALLHADVIAQIAESERYEGRSGYPASLYDGNLLRLLVLVQRAASYFQH